MRGSHRHYLSPWHPRIRRFYSPPAIAILFLGLATLLTWPLVTRQQRAAVQAQDLAAGPVDEVFRIGQSIPGARADQAVTAAYFYRVKWGFQDEFIELFRKNHYPVLEAQVKSGRLLKVEAYAPRFHGDGRADWTFMTVLTFKNWQAFGDNSEELELMKKLYPDQDKFKKEEQRRFELLEAHWDVPLNPMPMK